MNGGEVEEEDGGTEIDEYGEEIQDEDGDDDGDEEMDLVEATETVDLIEAFTAAQAAEDSVRPHLFPGRESRRLTRFPQANAAEHLVSLALRFEGQEADFRSSNPDLFSRCPLQRPGSWIAFPAPPLPITHARHAPTPASVRAAANVQSTLFLPLTAPPSYTCISPPASYSPQCACDGTPMLFQPWDAAAAAVTPHAAHPTFIPRTDLAFLPENPFPLPPLPRPPPPNTSSSHSPHCPPPPITGSGRPTRFG